MDDLFNAMKLYYLAEAVGEVVAVAGYGLYVGGKYVAVDVWQPEKSDFVTVIQGVKEFLGDSGYKVISTDTGSSFTRFFPWTDAKWYIEFITDIPQKKVSEMEDLIEKKFPQYKLFKLCLYSNKSGWFWD